MAVEAYLEESILDTEAQPSSIWGGSYNMPTNYGDVFTQEEIDQLIAYLLAL